ncbi:MAG: thioredoxin [Chloroflexota bacterium]
MAKPIEVTDATFKQEVLEADKPVLVDFWAEWCMPCHAIAPYVEAIANEYAGKLKVAKLDIDSNMATATQYQVWSIPTLILFKDGQPVERVTGAMPKQRILSYILPHLNGGS